MKPSGQQPVMFEVDEITIERGNVEVMILRSNSNSYQTYRFSLVSYSVVTIDGISIRGSGQRTTASMLLEWFLLTPEAWVTLHFDDEAMSVSKCTEFFSEKPK